MLSLTLEDLSIEITYKAIKNVHLRVYPPHGQIRISAPLWISLEDIRRFVKQHLSWIRQQQHKIMEQQENNPQSYANGDSILYRGKRYKLELTLGKGKPKVGIEDNRIRLEHRPGQNHEKRRDILNQWYREQLKCEVALLIDKYEPILHVKVKQFGIKKMKTRWGSCNIAEQRIWINLELIKRSDLCLEYVVLHEMLHLLEAYHNKRFYQLLDYYMPGWQTYSKGLKKAPPECC